LSRWSHFNLFVFGLVDLNSVLTIPRRFTGSAAQRIGAINVELAELRRSNHLSLTDRLRERALGLSLASILVAEAEPRTGAPAVLTDFQRLAPVLTYIETHLADSELSRDRLAVLACLSPSRFFAVFKGALGIGPTEYIRNLRLQKAQRLLIGTDGTVQEIAVQAGFPDPFHFSRLFKRHFGVSPVYYRNVVRNSLRQ
jgi:transcriptional regulator GlxA family with amidase domain